MCLHTAHGEAREVRVAVEAPDTAMVAPFQILPRNLGNRLAWELVEAPWPVVGAAVLAGLGLAWGWRLYQRCPHCGRVTPRVYAGWKRCRHCGRQYRKGLRLR